MQEVEQLRQEKQDIDQQLRAVQGTSLGSMQNFPVQRRSERGFGNNDEMRSSNSRGTSRGRGRGGRGNGRDGRDGGSNPRYGGKYFFYCVIGRKSLSVCFVDGRGRDASSDNYNNRGNNNFYSNDRSNNGPRNSGGSSIGHSGGFQKSSNSGRGNGNDRRSAPAPTVASKTDGCYADGDYGWADDDASSSTVLKTTQMPVKNSLAIADKGKNSSAGATDTNEATNIRDPRPSIDRDSNSSAEGANNRRRRRTKVNNNYSQACK